MFKNYKKEGLKQFPKLVSGSKPNRKAWSSMDIYHYYAYFMTKLEGSI